MRKVKARRRSIRQRIWQAMRIKRRFTVPDLCRIVSGATTANVQSYVSRLYLDGYLRKFGTYRKGQPGEYQAYQLVKDIGATMPVLLKGRHKKKEEETETEKPAEEQQLANAGELTEAPEDLKEAANDHQ